jgi:hypothetical protein
MFANPTQPNLADFATFVANQGVPAADLPSGTLTTVNIATSGILTASSVSGTVAAGMALFGSGVSNTYLSAWNSGTASGTVSPAPATAVNASSLTAYSPYLQWALTVAMDVTLFPPPCMPVILYVLAVYNYGMHKLLKIAQDQPGQTFFSGQRANFNLMSFTAGAVSASSDQSTSTTLVTPDFLKGLTIGDLDLLSTPWGREYLDYSSQYGPNIVGVS